MLRAFVFAAVLLSASVSLAQCPCGGYIVVYDVPQYAYPQYYATVQYCQPAYQPTYYQPSYQPMYAPSYGGWQASYQRTYGGFSGFSGGFHSSYGGHEFGGWGGGYGNRMFSGGNYTGHTSSVFTGGGWKHNEGRAK